MALNTPKSFRLLTNGPKSYRNSTKFLSFFQKSSRKAPECTTLRWQLWKHPKKAPKNLPNSGEIPICSQKAPKIRGNFHTGNSSGKLFTDSVLVVAPQTPPPRPLKVWDYLKTQPDFMTFFGVGGILGGIHWEGAGGGDREAARGHPFRKNIFFF